MNRLYLFVIIVCMTFLACEQNLEPAEKNTYPDEAITLNDTLVVHYKSCLIDSRSSSALCFDSVLTDSRCPQNLICIWAGEAIVRLKLKTPENPALYFEVRDGAKDFWIDKYHIAHFELLPYPVSGEPLDRKDYKIKMVIDKRKG